MMNEAIQHRNEDMMMQLLLCSSASMRMTSVTTTLSTSNAASAHPVAGLPVISLPVDNAAWARGLLNQQKKVCRCCSH